MELVNLKQALDKAKDQLLDHPPVKLSSARKPVSSIEVIHSPARPQIVIQQPSSQVQENGAEPVSPVEPKPLADAQAIKGEMRSPVVIEAITRQMDMPVEPVNRQIEAMNRHAERRNNPDRSVLGPTARRTRTQALQFKLTTTLTLKTSPYWLEQNRVITAHPIPEVIASYKVLRTQILQKMRANKWNSVGVVTARHSQGGSLTAVNLAISLAQEVTQSVLLADFNFRTPGLHHLFGIDPPCGIDSFLFGDRPLSDILVCPDISRLVLLPCLAPIENASELLNSPRMLELVDDLRQRYEQRIVVCDLPPVLEGDDVLAFAPNIDAVLLVVEENKTTRDDVLQVVELLKNIPLVGTVLNKSCQ